VETGRSPFSEWVWLLVPEAVSVLVVQPEEITPLPERVWASVTVWV
jgi:hypothetical protein